MNFSHEYGKMLSIRYHKKFYDYENNRQTQAKTKKRSRNLRRKCRGLLSHNPVSEYFVYDR